VEANVPIYTKQGGAEQVIDDGGLQSVKSGGVIRLEDGARLVGVADPPVFHVRLRATIAQVNAGIEVLPAIEGYAYRLVDAAAIAVGGAAGAVTTVDLLATASAASRKLVAFGQAQLTQSTLLRAGATGGTVLADGASFTVNDANTAVTLGKTGDDVTTATHIDLLVSYVVEEA